MRTVLATVLVLACNQSPLPPARERDAERRVSVAGYDVIIRNGEIIDGTGSARKHADVGIRNDTMISARRPRIPRSTPGAAW